MRELTLGVIARIHSDFPEKFGIPRQSGLVPETEARIVFEPEFRDPKAVEGLEGFDYIWLLWQFELPNHSGWQKTVRPPRLGGKETVGVFASRSPYRPNPVGLSSVRLLRIEYGEKGPVLIVSGADLRDLTPIFDIKPYLTYADSHPGAREGFVDKTKKTKLSVFFPEELLNSFPEEKREAAIGILSQDPRPSYGYEEDSVYGVAFAGKDIRFSVEGDRLTVHEVTEYGKNRVK